MARTLLVIGLLASVVFGWHLYGASDVRRYAEDLRTKHGAANGQDPVEVNPVTDVVTVPIGGMPPKSDGDNPLDALGKALGSMIGGALVKALEPSIERDLNLRAREQYDLYAIVLPYRVRVVPAEKGGNDKQARAEAWN
jgi:hypothetical protein